jgi:type I restriction enzyme S subunit
MKTWPLVALGDIAPIVRRSVEICHERSYPELGIRSFGRGTFHKPALSGADVGTKRLFQIEPGDLVFSNVFAWEGAIAVASPADAGRFGSHRFITCVADAGRANATFLKLYLTTAPAGREQVLKASPGGAGRNRTLGVEKMGQIQIPLPPLAEQQALVARLDALAEKTRQVEAHLDAVERDAEHLLALRFRDAIADAPLRPMADVAPSIRRTVAIDINTRYREVGARSFGKGLFIKPDFDGAEATWQKPVWIKAGDLVLSNIKAWEGAIGIAGDAHDGCIASHRYITCVPDPERATTGFLAYYLLTEDGLEKIGLASPGTADRNRTLSLGNLGKIEVPVPPLSAQQAFNHMKAEIAALKAKHAAIRQANAALLPATLERVFKA